MLVYNYDTLLTCLFCLRKCIKGERLTNKTETRMLRWIQGVSLIVEELREQLGWYCAHLSTSMKFHTDVDQNILNSFFEGAKAGAHWGRHNRKIQYGRQPILDFVITSQLKVVGS